MKKLPSIVSGVALIASLGMTPAYADAAKPGQSMTHLKTVEGITSALEGLGVVLFAQGGATSGFIGDSINSGNGQVVFHIPVTTTKSGVAHKGSNVVFFNMLNNKQLQVRNPNIDLTAGAVKALIPQVSEKAITLFTISNAATLKPAVSNDKRNKLRTSAYKGAALSLAPGVAAVIATQLDLPAGSLSDGVAFATADVTIYSKIK